LNKASQGMGTSAADPICRPWLMKPSSTKARWMLRAEDVYMIEVEGLRR